MVWGAAPMDLGMKQDLGHFGNTLKYKA